MQWLSLKRHYWLWRTRKQRKVNNLLAQYWAEEFIQKNSPCNNSTFLAVDIETSSLELSTGELLSIGWITIHNGHILLNTAEYHLIKPQHSVGSSATIHHLRDCELENGISTEKMMQQFLTAARNKILIFHHAELDTQFLNHICKQHFKLPLLWPTIDTLQIEKKVLDKKQIPIRQSTLRLASCRSRYNLPPYTAHNALSDALATAELFLAQLSYKSKDIYLSDLL